VRRPILAALIAAGWLGSSLAGLAQPLSHVAVGAPAPDFTLRGADGAVHRLSDYRGKIVFLNWTSPVCPFTAHQYATHAMQDLQARVAKDGAVWLAINTSKPGRPGYLTADQAKARLAKLQARVTAFLFDDGQVGRTYGARATPAIYVIDKTGRVAYEGAFDDDAGGTGVVRHVYGRDALNALRAGKPVATPQTQQAGCPVEY
jgi:peroxiredoxin